jgi:hypothetical protein
VKRLIMVACTLVLAIGIAKHEPMLMRGQDPLTRAERDFSKKPKRAAQSFGDGTVQEVVPFTSRTFAGSESDDNAWFQPYVAGIDQRAEVTKALRDMLKDEPFVAVTNTTNTTLVSIMNADVELSKIPVTATTMGDQTIVIAPLMATKLVKTEGSKLVKIRHEGDTLIIEIRASKSAKDPWYKDAIDHLNKKGIIKGFPDVVPSDTWWK